MKKFPIRTLLVGFLFTFCLTLSANAQFAGNDYPGMTVNGGKAKAALDTLPYRFNVVLMPLSFLGQGLEMAGEVLVGKKTSLRLGGGYFLGTSPSFYRESEGYTGWRGELQVRFFTDDVAAQHKGYYFGPFLQVKHIRLEQHVTDNSNPWVPIQTLRVSEVTAPSFGIIMGYQSVLSKGFFVDTFVGGGLIVPNDVNAAKEVHIGFVNPYNRGVIVRGGIGIGLAR